MGGKEGGRGYLYQGIVAVLEALRRNNWDRIYIEFPTEGDKVDIALKSADTITDAIQVKSTVNSFSKGDISKWLKDIITDYPCQRYCLVLIGNCAVSAVDFMNAITKFQTGISIFLLPRLMRLCFILGKYPVHLESVFCTNMILNNEATALTYRPFSLTGKEDLNERNTNLFSGFLD